MINYYLIGVTFLVSSTVVFAVKKIAIKFSMFDMPNIRSSHSLPTPRFGGIGVLVSFFIALLVYLNNNLKTICLEYPIAIGGVIILIGISLLDDIKPISSKLRFFVHFLFSLSIVFSGIILTQLDLVFFQLQLNSFWAIVVTSFFIMACINIYNFMDGIDGYAGGVGGLASIAFAGVYFMQGYSQYGEIMLLLAAAIAGFLIFNYPKASIFMGDIGSTTLGAIFSVVSIHLVMISNLSLVVPLMILSVFYLDATVTLFIRVYNKESFLEAHRSHFYQKLVRSGWSHQRVIWVEYGHLLINIILAFLYNSYSLLMNRALIIVLFLFVFGVKYYLIQKRFEHYLLNQSK